MRTRSTIAAVAVLLLTPSTALASLATEQHQGRTLAAQIQAGTRTCATLSAEDFDHIGEYAMFRALGSTRLHRAMNEGMTRMLGPSGESRMHQLLGRRYAGCSGSGSPLGYGMMGGIAGGGTMMSSGDWGWMVGGRWRHMSSQDWQQLEQRLFGTNGPASHGLSPLAVVAITLGGTVLVAVVLLIAFRYPFRRPPGNAAEA